MKRKLLKILPLYCGSSYYLLHHPEVLHPNEKQQKRLKMPELPGDMSHYVIAHRGGSMENPENTLQAFQHAVKIGAHMIETDVRMSRDGVIIVAHDDGFIRLCGSHHCHKLIKDTDAKDLPLFKN
jgi:glycerophosphoryl diester phosphodiesterase